MLRPKATPNDYMGNVINGILDLWKTYMLESRKRTLALQVIFLSFLEKAMSNIHF